MKVALGISWSRETGERQRREGGGEREGERKRERESERERIPVAFLVLRELYYFTTRMIHIYVHRVVDIGRPTPCHISYNCEFSCPIFDESIGLDEASCPAAGGLCPQIYCRRALSHIVVVRRPLLSASYRKPPADNLFPKISSVGLEGWSFFTNICVYRPLGRSQEGILSGTSKVLGVPWYSRVNLSPWRI